VWRSCCRQGDVGTLAFAGGWLLYHSATILPALFVVIHTDSLTEIGKISSGGTTAPNVTLGNIPAAWTELGVEPPRMFGSAVLLPAAISSGESSSGETRKRPEITEEDLDKCRRMIDAVGITPGGMLSRSLNCSCHAPIPEYATFGELETAFMEGLPCGCSSHCLCCSCGMMAANTSPDTRMDCCPSCGGSFVVSVFALFEWAYTNEGYLPSSPRNQQGGFGAPRAKPQPRGGPGSVLSETNTVSSTVLTSDGVHVYALTFVPKAGDEQTGIEECKDASAGFEQESKEASTGPGTGRALTGNPFNFSGHAGARFATEEDGDDGDEEEEDVSFVGDPFGERFDSFHGLPFSFVAAPTVPLGFPMAATTAAPPSRSGRVTAPTVGDVRVDAFCPSKGFVPVKSLTLKRQTTDSRVAVIKHGSTKAGLTVNELQLGTEFTCELWVRLQKPELSKDDKASIGKGKGGGSAAAEIEVFHLSTSSGFSVVSHIRRGRLVLGILQNGNQMHQVCHAPFSFWDTWTHVGVVVSSGGFFVYVNGEQMATGGMPGALSFGASSAQIVGKHTFKACDSIAVCGIRLWKVARSQGELRDAMKLSVVEPDHSGLLGQWPLNEGLGVTAYDASCRLGHGTLTAVSWIDAQRPTDPSPSDNVAIPLQLQRVVLYTSSFACDGAVLFLDTIPMEASSQSRLFRVGGDRVSYQPRGVSRSRFVFDCCSRCRNLIFTRVCWCMKPRLPAGVMVWAWLAHSCKRLAC
jgi:hypothetical protein